MVVMDVAPQPAPADFAALQAALTAAEARADLAEAELAAARARASDDQARIAQLKLLIAKLQRERFGVRAERTRRLLDQLELQLEELEADAGAAERAAEAAAARTTAVAGFTRRKPARKPFPEHLPRERVVVPGPCACAVCGGTRLRKLGEDVSETLESIPRQWKVIQHVREKFSCRDCEAVSQSPAPFHVVPRGWAGPSLLAMVLFEKFGQRRRQRRQQRHGDPCLRHQISGPRPPVKREPFRSKLTFKILSATSRWQSVRPDTTDATRGRQCPA
jgi:transposase